MEHSSLHTLYFYVLFLDDGSHPYHHHHPHNHPHHHRYTSAPYPFHSEHHHHYRHHHYYYYYYYYYYYHHHQVHHHHHLSLACLYLVRAPLKDCLRRWARQPWCEKHDNYHHHHYHCHHADHSHLHFQSCGGTWQVVLLQIEVSLVAHLEQQWLVVGVEVVVEL